MRSFSRQRKAFHDFPCWPPTTFSGSDYFWILRLWTDKVGLGRKGA